MGSVLPRDLKQRVDRMPVDYRYAKNIFLKEKGLIVKKPDPGEERRDDRRYRYFRVATGEEMDPNYYKIDGKTGILTVTCASLPTPVILGRQPNEAMKRFKIWHGHEHDFADNNAQDLVFKDIEEPDWVAEARKANRSSGSVSDSSRVERAGTTLSDNEVLPDIPYLPQPTPIQRSTTAGAPTVQSSQLPFQSHDTDLSSDDEPVALRSRAAQARRAREAREASMELGRSLSIRNRPLPRSISTKKAAAIKIEDDDTSMVDVASPGPRHTVSPFVARPSPMIARSSPLVGPCSSMTPRSPPLVGPPSPLDNLQLHFVTDGLAPPPRRWMLCNTSKKLFSQALARGVLANSRDMNALQVTVGAADGSYDAFRLAEGDQDDFEGLRAALVQVVGDWGIDGTTVYVSRI